MVTSLNTGAKALAPMVVLGGFAWQLQDGVLCCAEAMEQTAARSDQLRRGLSICPEWTQVDNFELEPDVQQQIDRAFTVLLSLDTQESLTSELQAWEDRERMNPLRMCAQERLDTRALNSDQLYYLQRFVQRWDRCAAEGTFNHNAWLGQNELLAREGEAS